MHRVLHPGRGRRCAGLGQGRLLQQVGSLADLL